MDFNQLWCEKHRPKTLESLCISDETREILEVFKKNHDIPHLLFTSTPGSGKTSVAKIIVNDILKCDYLYINASDENGIDTIRHKIIGYAQTKSFDGGIKVVILDECLHEDTLISVLRNGTEQQIRIKDVDECNDLVKTFNFSKNRIEWRPFYKIDKNIQDVYEVEFENGEIVCCTAEHKWYVSSPESNIPIRKKLIDIINEGIDEIVTVNEFNVINTLKIKKINKLDKKAHVYDLSVDETHNFFVGKKQVLTSNCDGVTVEGMRALRNVMEEYADNTRFILTANYKHKIIPAIQSRCQTLSFSHNISDVAKHCVKILNKEGIIIPKDQFVSFQSLIKSNFPDFRKILNELQKYSLSGTLNIRNSSLPDEFIREIYTKILKEDSIEFREFVIKNESVFQSDYHSLLKALLNLIYNETIDSMKKKESIMVLGHHMDRHSSVMDIEINAFVAMVALSKIFHS